jgi:hypothetical protein
LIRTPSLLKPSLAVAATLLIGSVGFEREPDARGERLIWIERLWLNKARGHAPPWRELFRRHPAAGRARGALGVRLGEARNQPGRSLQGGEAYFALAMELLLRRG